MYDLPKMQAQKPAISTTGLPKKSALQGAAVKPASAQQVPPIVHDVLISPGQPLDATTRTIMEPRFGQDFSRVRVHTDMKATESARAVNARAYTVGNHVVIADSQNVTNTSARHGLLAHELAHVVQQSGAIIHDRLVLGDPGSRYEREADRAAMEVGVRQGNGIGRMQAGPISALSTVPGTGQDNLHHDTQPQNHSLIQRQTGDDDPKRKFPPDWQHGAPTKPVSPDPHVAPAPGTKPDLKETPFRGPQPSRETEEKQEFSTREKIANALKSAGVPPWAAAAMVVLVIAALADPEPFSKVALIIGVSAALVVFAALGGQSKTPPSA